MSLAGMRYPGDRSYQPVSSAGLAKSGMRNHLIAKPTVVRVNASSLPGKPREGAIHRVQRDATLTKQAQAHAHRPVPRRRHPGSVQACTDRPRI